MSTDYKTQVSNTHLRFADLAAMGEVVFHVSDLASLWGIRDKNTLYTTLKRYTQRGLLHRIQKGLYSIRPPRQIDPHFLGIKALHTYAYVTAETILFREGIISQRPAQITLVSPLSRRFFLLGKEYLCRKLDERYLYQPQGIIERDGVREASASRAVADLLYYNPKMHFDGAIDWKEVRRVQKQIGYPITQ